MESDFLATIFPFFPGWLQYFELGILQFPMKLPDLTSPSIHLHLGWQPRLSPGTDLPVGFAKAVLTV
jgi:hypothetical protein